MNKGKLLVFLQQLIDHVKDGKEYTYIGLFVKFEKKGQLFYVSDGNRKEEEQVKKLLKRNKNTGKISEEDMSLWTALVLAKESNLFLTKDTLKDVFDLEGILDKDEDEDEDEDNET